MVAVSNLVWVGVVYLDSSETDSYGVFRQRVVAGDLGWAGGRYPVRFYLHAVPLNPMSWAENPILGRAILAPIWCQVYQK